MLKYDDKAILYNPELYDESSLLKKIRTWWWGSWIYEVYEYSWAYHLRWHVTHWWRKDHWVKTNLPIGYHDKTNLMEDALFTLVDDYASRDQEDAFSKVEYDTDLIEIKKKIIEIIHFYNVRREELQKRCDDLLHLCYGDMELIFTDEETKPGFKKLEMVNHSNMDEDHRQKKIEEMHSLETQIFEETQEMLKKCIEVRPYLWT